jgi:hypothetical protein
LNGAISSKLTSCADITSRPRGGYRHRAVRSGGLAHAVAANGQWRGDLGRVVSLEDRAVGIFDALAGIYFGREDVSLRVNGNVVQSRKMRLQRPPNRYEVSI